MANTTIQPAPIRQAIFDASGNMTRAWVVYFQSLLASVANLSGSQTEAATQLTTLASGMAGAIPKTRHILTQAPLTGGGDLSVDRTLAISTFQGDFGAGGLAGAVPAPHAGDAAAGKFLKASGGWAVPPTASTTGGAASLLLETNGTANGSQSTLNLAAGTNMALTDSGTGTITLASTTVVNPVIGFIIGDGSTGSNIGPMLAAARSGAFSKCVVTVRASDGATALTFAIKQNGTSVFSSSPTVAAGTATGTLTTFTTLTTVPLSVAANDVFSIDITSGSSSWKFTAQLE